MKIIIIILAGIIPSLAFPNENQNHYPNSDNAFGIALENRASLNYRHKITDTNYLFFNLRIYKNEDTINPTSNSGYFEDSDTQATSLTLGLRKYLTKNKVSIFAEGGLTLQYRNSEEHQGVPGDSERFTYKSQSAGLEGSLGGEYFVFENFSVEGKLTVNAIYRMAKGDFSGNQKYVSSRESGIIVNYYF